MFKLMIIGAALFSGLVRVSGVDAQTLTTKIARIEIDEKEYKGDYKVSFLIGETLVKAERIPTGFIVPLELQREEYLDFVITFGQHRLEFSEMHISNFSDKWIVGVDLEPYTYEELDPEEAKKTRQLYYITFLNGHGRQLIVRKIDH